MTAIDIARRLAELGQAEKARAAYELVVHQGAEPEGVLEGALYILQSGGDHRRAFTALCNLHGAGQFQAECLDILTQAFYTPNERSLKARYEKNCRQLAKYPYLFRKDFLDFEALPLRFYPFDDSGYVPYHLASGRFGDYIKPKKQVISRNFFRDLENPILAKDVYSQYELEYLNDNVRKSEDIGRENHVYLHYSDWGMFCAWLQVLNVRPILKERKLVFLIEDEIGQYPIDFKERFGIDYSVFPVQPVRIREFQRLIWNMQLSSHNGGNFFNEIIDGHPNLIATPSIMLDNIDELVQQVRDIVDKMEKAEKVDMSAVSTADARQIREILGMKGRTAKDLLVTGLLSDKRFTEGLDPAARIVPAIYLQPHFGNIIYHMKVDPKGQTVLYSDQYEAIRASGIFRNFKYIKTFTAMRRLTTSYGACIRYEQRNAEAHQASGTEEHDEEKPIPVVGNELINRLTNRSFMIDPEDRLTADSVLVRFEDGKLNPKATFTALAAFMDVPYTESMTYCSMLGKRDPESLKGDEVGFSMSAVYRSYDEYANDEERAFIEYFMRDVYEAYGYDFHFYDGRQVDEEQVNRWISGFTTAERYICDTWQKNVFAVGSIEVDDVEVSEEQAEQVKSQILEQYRQALRENWHTSAQVLMRGLNFVNKNGQPLRMIPKLELDPELLEQPVYH